MKIVVDAMGGDHAPEVVVQGACLAAQDGVDDIILVGRPDVLRQKLGRSAASARIRVVAAHEVIDMHEPAATSVRRKKGASINVGMRLVKDREADAFVSAGNTGAVVCAASLFLRQLPGIDRPGISVQLPTLAGFVQVIDMGANIDAKPKHLLHYGIMGALYSRYVLHKQTPRVGLLNIGAEESKGTEFVRETFKLMEQCPHIHFIGNVEGRDIYTGSCDVIVCDGFVGNVVLKVSEGLADAMKEMLRRKLYSGMLTKLGALLSAPAFRALKKETDYSEYGGAPLLGVDGACIISHGGSSAKAIKNAIRAAGEFCRNNVNRHIMEIIAPSGGGRSS